MKFYIPTQALMNARFSESYKRLLQEGIVKDISSTLRYNHNICSSDPASVEFNHNRFIQQRFFNTEFYRSSKPVYLWDKDKRLHVNRYDGSYDKIKLLDVSLATSNPNHVWVIFYIIEFSYWADYTIQQILPWIDRLYVTLRRSYMAVIRLPSIIKMSLSPALLRLGNCYSNAYYMWNGSKSDVCNQLIYIRDNYLDHTHAAKKISVVNLKKYHDDINDSISVLSATPETLTMPVVIDEHGEFKEKPIVNEPLENVDKLFDIPIPDLKRMAISDYAKELIAKLGPGTASCLAQEIIHNLVL